MEQIKQVEGIYERIQKVEQEIKEKTEKRDEFFLRHENERLDKIKEQLNKYVELLNSTIPLKNIEGLIKQRAMSSEKGGRNYNIRLSLDFSNGILGFAYRNNDIYANNGLQSFVPIITKNAKYETQGIYTLSCERYEKLFQRQEIDPEVFIDLLKNIVVEIIQRLEKKLDELQQQAANIFVPDTDTSDNIEGQQRIIIGQFQNYKVVLEREE